MTNDQRIFRLAMVEAALRLLIGAAIVTQAAPVLYGITFNEQLITINTATGAGTLVGNLSSAMDPYGLGATGGKLYTFDQNADLLRQLDPATAATVASINLSFASNLVGEGGVDFRSDGAGFLASASPQSLYSFTTAAGSGALIGSPGITFDGLAFSGGDVLYALSQSDAGIKQLYTVNQTTAAATLVGSTGIANGNSLGGLDFIGAILYAVMNDTLYSINTGTGAATLIGRIGFENVSGIASLDDVAVPEPAALLLLRHRPRVRGDPAPPRQPLATRRTTPASS